LAKKPNRDAINTALIDSSKGGGAEIMQALLDAGADVNFQKDDVTPLSEAARGLNFAGVQLLLSRGANVNPDFREGWLPLHHAVYAIDDSSPSKDREQKQMEIVQALLSKGANMEARARSMVQWQPTPLLLAIDRLRSRIALLLIERGADVNTKTIDPGGNERTALMWAADKGLDEVVRALIAKGAPVNAPNNVGDTALMVAAEGNGANFGRNQPTVVRTLLALGADIEARNARGLTSLMRAAPTDTDVLTALLEAGASVNVTSRNGWTALMVAAAYGNSKNIQFLLDKGADLRLRNKDGNDAIALATKADYKKAALLLSTYAASGKAAQDK
jgi:ankyrin repeat protein